MKFETTRRQLFQLVAALPVASNLIDSGASSPVGPKVAPRPQPPKGNNPARWVDMVSVQLDGRWSEIHGLTAVQIDPIRLPAKTVSALNGTVVVPGPVLGCHRIRVAAALTPGNVALILERLDAMFRSMQCARWSVLGMEFNARPLSLTTDPFGFSFDIEPLESIKP